MTQPTKADGARALSLSEDEIATVADSPAGLIVITTDDVKYVVVDEDNPDAAGRHGVMFLVPPKLPYHGTFPVYSRPELPDLSEVEVVDPDDQVPDTASQRELLAWVGDDIDRAQAALEVEQAKEKPRSGVVVALGKRMAEIAEAAAGAPPLP